MASGPGAGGGQRALKAEESETAPLFAAGDAEANPCLIRNVPEAEWLERARKSTAALNVDRVLQGVASQSTLDVLKDQMFTRIYETMGDEMMPEDMVRALVVRTERYHPWLSTVLCFCTLGIFEAFRPRDDEAVVVLTKNERVSLYKVERTGTFQNIRVVLKATFFVILAFLLLNVLPYVSFELLGSVSMSDDLTWLMQARDGYREHVVERLQRSLWLQAIAWVAFVCFFLFWIWTKLPHDYGMRYRQSHAANKVCCGQFSLMGGNWFRRCKLRLFFGRFPAQGALDHQNNFYFGGGSVVIGDKMELALTNMANPFAPGSRKSVIILIILVLNLFTMMDVALTYGYTPWTWLEEGAQRTKFCQMDHTAETCTVKECQIFGITKWAQMEMDDPSFLNFCEGIHYVPGNNASAVAECAVTGKPAPCCGGCIRGALDSVKGRGIDLFGLAVSFVTDFGTLAVAFAAAAAALSYIDEKDHVDILFKKRMGFRTTETAHFDLTQHLANDFANTIITNALGDPEGKMKDGVVPPRKEADVPKRDYSKVQHGDSMQDTDSANFQDVTHFDLDTESTKWEEFWESGNELVHQSESGSWVPKVLVPVKCLGIPEGEHVVAAWVEMPVLNMVMMLPLALIAMVAWTSMLAVPDSTDMAFLRLSVVGDGQTDKVISATCWALIIFGALFVLLFCGLYMATKHVCILTNVRLVYVRYTVKARLLLMFAPQMRIDTFRHDHEVTYGSVMTQGPSLYQRATRAPWTPGQVYMQPGFYGILKLYRARGNVFNIYQMVSQLTKPGQRPFIDGRSIEAAGVAFKFCEETVLGSMERLSSESSDAWKIKHAQPDDVPGMMPNMYLNGKDEQPLFHWSFREVGWVNSGFNNSTDLVVTTNRVYLYNRALWKRFDAKTCCCFGFCYCPWLWRPLLGNKGLKRRSSFLDLRLLLSFTTEVEISPPVWYDPIRWPCKCPALDTCCRWFTLCIACGDRREVFCNSKTCSCMPRRSGARASLAMMWRHRFNSTQRDLRCGITPYGLPDRMLISDVVEKCGCGQSFVEAEEATGRLATNFQKIEMLRKIMGVVQDTASLKEKQAELPG